MGTELTMLLYSTLIFFVLVVVHATVVSLKMGIPWAFGNRDESAEVGAFARRLKRNVENHKEGLVFFAPVALLIAIAGLSTPMTVLGSQIYFFARLVHAVTYAAGIAYVRSFAWVAGIVGFIMMLIGLL
ncbi:MAG: MAPEG family protein [Pseudomonadota bacterium]